MRHGRIIYILGDVHGQFNDLNEFINRRIRLDKTLRAIAARWKGDGDDFQVMIFRCGDFAYFWPGENNGGKIRNQVEWLPGGRVPIYWTGGNHEDWDKLDSLGPDISEIERGVFYCPFGSTLEVSPDVTVLFAGGAESSDKDIRLEWMATGSLKCWWEQEGVSNADLARLESVPKADWVISHTAPTSFYVNGLMRSVWGQSGHLNEPSPLKLEQVRLKYEPSKWWFGHFHHHMTGRTENCDWMCLDMLKGSSRSWEKAYLEWEDA